MSMNHGCSFEYFYVNRSFGMDIPMDIAWIHNQGFLALVVSIGYKYGIPWVTK